MPAPSQHGQPAARPWAAQSPLSAPCSRRSGRHASSAPRRLSTQERKTGKKTGFRVRIRLMGNLLDPRSKKPTEIKSGHEVTDWLSKECFRGFYTETWAQPPVKTRLIGTKFVISLKKEKTNLLDKKYVQIARVKAHTWSAYLALHSTPHQITKIRRWERIGIKLYGSGSNRTL